MSEPVASTELEHPPIPPIAFEAAHNAVARYEYVLLPAQRLDVAVAAAAKVLWREWKRGMAVVPLPEPIAERSNVWGVPGHPKSAVFLTADVSYAGTPVIDIDVAEDHVWVPAAMAVPFVGAVLAAANRAEQLAAEQAVSHE